MTMDDTVVGQSIELDDDGQCSRAQTTVSMTMDDTDARKNIELNDAGLSSSVQTTVSMTWMTQLLPRKFS